MISIIFPIGGLILVNCLGLNLFYSYYSNVDKNNTELTINNIFIFIAFFFNSINWSIFALWYNDLWIFLAGTCIPIGSILCIMLLYTKLTQNHKRIVELLFFLGYLYILGYIILINFVPVNYKIKNSIVNYSLLFNILYFMSPLSSLVEIIKNKNTQTLYLPFTIINIIASCLWLIYGIIINNYFLISIYGLGILTSITEIILYIYYNFIYFKENEKDIDII